MSGIPNKTDCYSLAFQPAPKFEEFRRVYEYTLTGNEEPILMCHCAKTKFCHRHLVADWLEETLNVEIKEYNKPNHTRKNGYLLKRKEPSLFEDDD